MNKFFGSLLAVAALALAGTASASALDAVTTAVKGDYLQVQGGSQFNNLYGHDATVSVAFGRDFGAYSAEAEYLNTDISKTSLQSGGVNVYVHPVTYYNVTPFVGTGIAYGSIKGQNAATFNAQIGASYPLPYNLKAIVAYRYSTATVDHVGTDSSAITAGVRYTF